MKKIAMVLMVLTALSKTIFCQNNWIWASSAGGNGSDVGKSITADLYGNVYATGCFYSASITFGNFTLYNADSTQPCIYLVKYDAAGTVEWAKTAQGWAMGNGVVTDNDGNIFITGNYYSSLIQFGTHTLVNSGISSINYFLVKYNSAGTVLWANNINSQYSLFSQRVTSVATDKIGNVFITGNFGGNLNFGTLTLSASGISDIFLAKYTASGNLLWAKKAGDGSGANGNGCIATAVTADINNNVLITGQFSDPSLSFGSTHLINANTSASGDIFIAKFNESGMLMWANSVPGTAGEIANSIATDYNGNVFITGNYDDPAFLAGNTLILNYSSSFYSDVFLFKFDASGNMQWAKGFGSTGPDEGRGVITDANGNVYVTGYLNGYEMIFGEDTLTSLAGNNLFIAQFDGGGNFRWATDAEIGAGINEANSIAIDFNNNVYVTGYIKGTVTFGSNVLSANNGYDDSFIAKLNYKRVNIIDSDVLKSSTVIFPNPLSAFTTITFSEVQNNTTIKVFDAVGKEIKDMELVLKNEKSATLDMSSHAKGIYFVEITNENKNVINKKIVVN